jgi:hypothetical protein
VQDGVNAGSKTAQAATTRYYANYLTNNEKIIPWGADGAISSAGFMVHMEQLRDWKRQTGPTTSGLSERRDFLPRHAARRTGKILEYIK